jgi:TolB-like protein/Flp pilus assembly protein TadD
VYATFHRRLDVAAIYETRRLLDQCLALESGFARAHVLYSATRTSAWALKLDDDYLNPSALEDAVHWAERAVQHDPNLPQAHVQLGYALCFRGMVETALTHMERAISLNPSFTDWRISCVLATVGQAERAAKIANAHLRADPFALPIARGYLGFAYLMLRRCSDAVGPLREFVSQSPNHSGGRIWLTAAYAHLGQLDDARAQAAQLLRIDPSLAATKSFRKLETFRRPEDDAFVTEGLRKAGLDVAPIHAADTARASATALPLPDSPSIAVLPFANMSSDSEHDYLVDGIVDDIITALSHFRWLFVIARNSSFTYKGRAVEVKQVARELGVRYVLEGSVRKEGHRVRIATQLIDASTGGHISAQRFDGELKDIFDLQEKVAASVAGAIAPQLERSEMERARRKPTDNLDAHGYFMRASASMYRWTGEGNDEGIRLLRKAIELDPTFASAYGLATHHYCFRKSYGPWGADREQAVAETATLARRAIEFGKDDAFALCWAAYSLAYVVGELDDGAAFIDRALALNPNLARAWHHSGWIRIWLGKPDVAIEHLSRAMRLSPLDPAFHAMQAATASGHFFAGRHDEASSWAESALREQPNNLDVIGLLAMSDALAGRLEKARGGMARLVQKSPDRRLCNIADRMPSYRRPEDSAKVIRAARLAGLPE